MIAGYFHSPIAVSGLKERGKTANVSQADGQERSSKWTIEHLRIDKK